MRKEQKVADMDRPYVLQLGGLSRGDARLAGAKAANLGDLLAAGFSVPDGFVLTTMAFDRFLTLHGFAAGTPAEEVAAAPLPDDVSDALSTAAASLADLALAVRSSGVAEDLPGASFAGQYETMLGVRGHQALRQAVTRCWASAFSGRVAAYQSMRGEVGLSPMAVLVQKLVEADSAGVAFTANPVTGDRSETVVTGVWGLGERLVSGEAQPDEWLVRGTYATCLRSPEGALDQALVLAIAETARRVQGHFEAPQDVEWAVRHGQIYIVQARPITALSDSPVTAVPVPVDPPPGFWQREATHAPRPISPLIADWVTGLETGQNAAFREMFAAYGLLLESLEFREIGGWVYVRAVPLGGKDRRPPPNWLMWLLVRTVFQLRSRIAQARRAIRADLHGQHIERWYDEWRPKLATDIRQLAAVELPALSDEGLATHLDAVTAHADQCVRIHFLLHGALVMVLGEFLFACRELLGWGDQDTFALLAGLSEASSEPAHRLAELAAMAAERPAVRTLLERANEGTLARLAGTDVEFAAAFESYRAEYGCRALRYDPVDPTLGECPELLLGLIRDQIARSYDPTVNVTALEQTRAAGISRARTAAEHAGDLPRFERALNRAERAYPVREDSEFYTVSAPLGLIRYAGIELGRRLAARGQLDEPEDVFWLRWPEARQALGDGRSLVDLVGRRRGERAWVQAHPGPPSYGTDPGPPPPFSLLPAEARFVAEAMQQIMVDRILAPEDSQREQPNANQITGIAAAPGRYSGPVRVIMDETQFDKIRPGDVLVCPITSPVWSVLFPSVGALVTDTGGILSHAAIIAREYRLPAVVGTGNATALLHDGQTVTVDGERGTVDVTQPAGRMGNAIQDATALHMK
jgi:rifampicin phosphotransferase